MTRKVIMAKTQQHLKILAATAALLTLSACGSNHSADGIAQSSLQVVGCKSFQSEMWNSLYKIAEEGMAFPASSDLKTALLDAGSKKGWTGAKFERFVDSFVANYEVTIEGIKTRFAPEDPEAWKKALAEMEVGIRVTDVHAELADKISSTMAKMDQAEQALDASCEAPDSGDGGSGDAISGGGKDGSLGGSTGGSGGDQNVKFETVWDQVKAVQGVEVYGARKALATAYQSCSVLSLGAMTTSTPSLEGLRDIGSHSNGVGRRREIASLPTVLSTHYYIKNQNLAKNTCFEVRKSPMIYDYGGKPATSTSSPYNLNMFKNAGSGGPELGIDCSAFVFSALGLAGLKLDPDPNKVMKALLVGAFNAAAFKEPQSNGMKCLDKISVSKTTTVLPGDIIAIKGHVMMIDSIGEDPLGLDGITSLSGCTSTNVKSSNFDFVVAQSSSSKGAIGINRYAFADYAKTSATFKAGVEAYAMAACRAKFGASANLSSPNLSIVRHKKTAACKAPRALTEENESCVDSCRAL